MQSTASRALVALAAIAVVVVGFFVILGDDEAGQGSAVADPTTTTSTSDETTADKPAGDPEQRKPDEEPEVPTVVLQDGSPKDGVLELEYSKGDEVRFAVESNTDQEIHVHGYEVEEEIPAGETVEVTFPADLDGIYEVESHSSGQQIAEIRVTP